MASPCAIVCPSLSTSAADGIALLEIQAMDSPAALLPNEVRISVRSASINFPDLLMMQGKYQMKPEVPFVLCSEGAGMVLEVGSKVSKVQVGDRVFFTSGITGAAAEVAVVPEGAVHLLPENMTFSQGAAFLTGYVTAYHALVHRGRVQAGEWLLVTGAGGGMGAAAVQVGSILGAKVIAAASSDEKLEVCKANGAVATVNYATRPLKDAVAEITGGELCDVIYDPVGGDVFDQCVRCVASKGYARLLVVGFADGRIPVLPVNMALIKGFDLVGCRATQLMMQPHLAAEARAELFKWVAEGKLTPHVGAEFPMERAKEAFTLMADRGVVGKCCITFGTTSSKL